MTLELLQFIRHNNEHLQGHQCQIIQVIEMALIKYQSSLVYVTREITI